MAELKVARYGQLNIVRTALFATFGGVFAYLQSSTLGVLLGMAKGHFVPAAFVTWSIWGKARVARPHLRHAKTLPAYGAPSGASLLPYSVARNADWQLLGTFAEPKHVGLYATGFDLPWVP